MRTVESAGTRICYEVAGSGPPLVLLHGLALTGSSWRLAGYLDELTTRFRCITVDARGAGRSDKPDLPADHALGLYVADVLAVLGQEEVDECALWGFSRGGGVASALAAAHPDRVKALVLTGAFDIGAPSLEEIEAERPLVDLTRTGGMSAMLAAWEAEEDPPLPEWFREMIVDYDARAWLATRIGGWAWPHVRDDRISAPTLVVVGSREDPDDEAAGWVARQADARRVIVRGRTHCGTFLAISECLASALPFLDRAVGDAPVR